MSDLNYCDLNYLYGKPLAQADFKQQAEDFIVDEVLGFELSGEGEHVCLQIVKKGENTQFIVKKLAEFAQTAPRNVSYAGLKDRHGVCSQWFSVPVPIKKDIDFSKLNSDSLFVLTQKRHSRKLKTGCHKGNKFTIRLRNVTEPIDVLCRINAVRSGVPNYFGPQRFGHGGHNLDMAKRMFAGERIRDRKLRGLIISAARSYVFNQIVDMRVTAHGLAKTLPQEVFMLSGSNAYFKEDINTQTIDRLASGDISLSAPLIGLGDKGLTDQELVWLDDYKEWREGLIELGLKTERRTLKLIPQGLTVTQENETELVLEFELNKGCYATTVLRELVNCTDTSLNKNIEKDEQ